MAITEGQRQSARGRPRGSGVLQRVGAGSTEELTGPLTLNFSLSASFEADIDVSVRDGLVSFGPMSESFSGGQPEYEFLQYIARQSDEVFFEGIESLCRFRTFGFSETLNRVPVTVHGGLGAGTLTHVTYCMCFLWCVVG